MFATLGALPCFGVVIWTNPITGTNPGAVTPYTTGDAIVANLTVSGIGRGAGLFAVNGANQYNADGFDTGALVLTNNDYFSFILTPTGGADIDFISLVYTGQLGSQGPTTFFLRSSALNNFGTDIGTATGTGATISLAAAAFQNITSAIEFRLYGAGSGSSNGNWAINDFSFDATVTAVPEPGVALLGAIGGISLLRRRRH